MSDNGLAAKENSNKTTDKIDFKKKSPKRAYCSIVKNHFKLNKKYDQTLLT